MTVKQLWRLTSRAGDEDGDGRLLATEDLGETVGHFSGGRGEEKARRCERMRGRSAAGF